MENINKPKEEVKNEEKPQLSRFKKKEEYPEIEKKEEPLTKREKELLQRIERLESVANKAGLSKFDTMHAEKKEKVVNLNMIDGKVIISWNNMPKNRVEKSPKTGHWEEEQFVEVVYEDGETETMPYVVFVRRYSHLKAKVKKEIVNRALNKEKFGRYSFEVETEDGKEYKLGSKFVN
uniref:Uncharacterized protein n=1 Tax=viral metagenome TaxID=1070528 RepID=A0A6M3KB12_9ZZZZ